jgi:hypothetical protein
VQSTELPSPLLNSIPYVPSHPAFIDDYNHHMNSVDLANQHRQPYNTQQIAYRTWILLLHWLLDQAAINAYKLAAIGKTWPNKDLDHLEFRRALYRKLLDYSKLVDPQLWKEPGPHKWADRPTRQCCVMCCRRDKLKKKFLAEQEAVGIHIFKPANTGPKRPSQCQSGCGYCDVALCRMSTCFSDWHAQKG